MKEDIVGRVDKSCPYGEIYLDNHAIVASGERARIKLIIPTFKIIPILCNEVEGELYPMSIHPLSPNDKGKECFTLTPHRLHVEEYIIR